MKTFGRFGAAILAGAIFCGLLGSAQATTIDFTYNSSTDFCACATATGSGSFSFNATSGAVNLADLTSFNFTMTVDDLSNPIISTFTFGLGDLSSFSLSSGDSPSASISFQTNYVPEASDQTFPEDFGLSGTLTSANGFNNYNADGRLLQDDAGPTTFSTTTSVPEPLTLSLFGATLAGAMAAVRRRRKANKGA